MATTSLLLMASDPNTTHDNSSMRPLYVPEETRPEPGRTRRRKAHRKGPNPKKLPQRGLGVAQLERIRLQETLNITEKPAFSTFNPSVSSFTVHDPLFGSDPLWHGAAASHGVLHGPQPAVINGYAVGMPAPMMGNRCLGSGGVGCSGFGRWLVANRVDMEDPFGAGAPRSGVLVGIPFETSKELSSMPNMHSASEYSCDVCLKKKRCNMDNNVKVPYTMRERPSDIRLINEHDLLRFSPQPPNFTTRAASAAAYASSNVDECVEVVAVRRKGKTVSGRVFIEYEFFPIEDGRGSPSKELELPALGYEASSITAAASNSVDLSLKLSY